jgi:predicted enzyme related to lactoylglutathione lyase
MNNFTTKGSSMSAPPNDTTGRLNYVEFSVPSIAKSKAFYEKAFGWALVDFGPTYAATVSGDADIGLQADNPGGAKPPLPVIQVRDLEASLERTLAAGAALVTPIFSFPGGR